MTLVSLNPRVAGRFALKCLTLGTFAVVAALFPGSRAVFTALIVAASLFAGNELRRILIQSEGVQFSRVLAVSILLGYAVGATVYLGYFQTTDATIHQYWQEYGLYYSQQSLGLALAAVLGCSSLLYAMSAMEYRKPLVSCWVELSAPSAERIVWLGLLLVVSALYTGEIGYMGPTTDPSGRITALGALAVLVTPPMVPYALAVALASGDRQLPKRYLLWMAPALFIGVTFVLGRRYLLYALVLSAMVVFARGYRLSVRHIGMMAVAGVIAAIALYVGFKFFMALRLAGWQLGPDVGLRELISTALLMLGSNESQEVEAQLSENVGTRTFILSYFASLVGGGSGQVPALGKELLYSVQMAVPSLLMPGKTAGLPASPEELMHPLYGLPVFDGPNTIVVAGYDDFGFLGAALYPLGLAIFYVSFYAFVCRVTSSQSKRLFVLFALLFQLFYVEQSLTANFVVLRDLVVVLVLLSIISSVPMIRLSAGRQLPIRRARFRPASAAGSHSLPIRSRK